MNNDKTIEMRLHLDPIVHKLLRERQERRKKPGQRSKTLEQIVLAAVHSDLLREEFRKP